MKKILVILTMIVMTACAGNNIDDQIKTRRNLSHTDRLIVYANDFVGTPYAPDPLGEGAGFDTDPVYDFGKFDCVTYVETVIALTDADNFNDFTKRKKCISYFNCDLDYIKRKHFFEIDHNDDLIDITDTMGIKTKQISGTIDRAQWMHKKSPDLKSNASAQPVTLSYISRDDVMRINTDTLPKISVVGIVMIRPELKEKIGSDVFLSHTGFLVKSERGLEIWHASSKAGNVTKQDFIEYMKSANRPGFKVWRIK